MSNLQAAFAVKQQCPKMVEEIVQVTLEMESYIVTVGSLNPDADKFTVGAIGTSDGGVGRMPPSDLDESN